jgi:hypothetical protein
MPACCARRRAAGCLACTGISHILLAGWLRYCRILSARGRAAAAASRARAPQP